MKKYSDYLSQFFPGIKVQKISVDAGFSCPNRDGSIGTGGCIYCRNDSFSPSYCNPHLDVKKQLEEGKKFFSRKYPEMKYLAYFQSYSGTYNKTAEELNSLYSRALEVEDVVGLIVATRPDCISDVVLDVLERVNTRHKVFIELGVESSHDDTLKLINRNHTWKDVVDATSKIALKNIQCGVHLIAGLPGENEDMILDTVDKVVSLPINTIKLHQLQVLKGTELLKKLENRELSIQDYSLEEYLELCVKIIKRVPENIVIERFLSQSPPEMVVSPSWKLKNYEFMAKLAKLL